jgi:protein SCO1/2
MMFVSDVIGDDIVVMDFVYTTCTTICPVLSALFAQVQTKLGDDVGNGITLVSMSVDPVRDTPQRMKAYSAKHGAGDGWIWLTGPKTVVNDVLTGLGAYTANFEDHPSMVLIGDGRTGEWKRLFGFPNPDRIVQVVNDMRERRKAGG